MSDRRWATHRAFRTVRIREYAAVVGEPTARKAEVKFSNLSPAPKGNWDTRATQGKSHALNCGEKLDHFMGSGPVPQALSQSAKVMPTAFEMLLTGCPKALTPPDWPKAPLRMVSKHSVMFTAR